MASVTALLHGTIFTSQETIYLAGGSSSQTPYSGSGTPWTAQSTTPYVHH
jgi:hypothetical protein